MTDTSGTVPPEPEEPMYAQLGDEGNPFTESPGSGAVDYSTEGEAVNPPLADPGQYDGEHGEGLDEPEEHPGVGN